jgi:hypothetical protein
MDDSGVFLSYAREDHAKVTQILQALRDREFPVFFDREMPAGVEWERVLESVLARAYGVVVVWSTHSVGKATQESAWIYREADVGFNKGRLFPIRIEPVTPPERFQSIQAADLSDWNGDAHDAKFEAAIALLRNLWEAEKGLLEPGEIMKPLRLKKRPVTADS